jgi:hypothetical protein
MGFFGSNKDQLTTATTQIEQLQRELQAAIKKVQDTEAKLLAAEGNAGRLNSEKQIAQNDAKKAQTDLALLKRITLGYNELPRKVPGQVEDVKRLVIKGQIAAMKAYEENQACIKRARSLGDASTRMLEQLGTYDHSTTLLHMYERLRNLQVYVGKEEQYEEQVAESLRKFEIATSNQRTSTYYAPSFDKDKMVKLLEADQSDLASMEQLLFAFAEELKLIIYHIRDVTRNIETGIGHLLVNRTPEEGNKLLATIQPMNVDKIIREEVLPDLMRVIQDTELSQHLLMQHNDAVRMLTDMVGKA